MKSLKIYILTLILIISFFGCTKSLRKEREQLILKRYSKEISIKYSNLLVDVNNYTSNGEKYHKAYYKYLIAIAADIIENKKLKISEKSIGFYFDKKADNKVNLYIGLDIRVTQKVSSDYGRAVKDILKSDLKEVITTMYSCETLFEEKNVVGLVAGFIWKSGKSMEQMNLWIKKGDILKYENNKLTFSELILISEITNASGKIIFIQV